MAARERTRRDVLKRAAIVGTAAVWATPVVQSIGGKALATPGSVRVEATSSTQPPTSTASTSSAPPNPPPSARVLGEKLPKTGPDVPVGEVMGVGIAAAAAGGYLVYRANKPAPSSARGGRHRRSVDPT